MSHGKTRFISCILLIAILFSVNISANTMATINGKEYSKASSAINEAKSGDTVKFTSEELNGSLTVENKNIVLDGITIKNSDDSALYIKNSVVTIKNGSVSAMGTGSAIILENSRLILENTVVKSQKRGISVTSSGNSYVKISADSKIITDGVGIYLSDGKGYCDIDIYGSMDCDDIYSVYCGKNYSGKLKIYDGAEIKTEIHNESADFAAFMYGGSFVSYTGFTFTAGELNISGGEVNAYGAADYAVYISGGKLNISGGIFTAQNRDLSVCVDGGFALVTGGMFYITLPDGIPQNAVKTTAMYCGKIYTQITMPTEKADYRINKTGAQIALLEPWGVRASACVLRNGKALSPSDYDKYGIKCRILFVRGDKKLTPVDEITQNNVKYAETESNSEGFFADYRGIYISEFDKYISFVFEVTADGETTYSKVISVTMNELIDMRLSMDDCKNAEADLLRFLKQYFAYIKAYIGN